MSQDVGVVFAAPLPEPAAAALDSPDLGPFTVHLEVFEGPFDLLLSLINRHQLDITEVALAEVTDEFLTYIRVPEVWDLGQATEFLVVAATLLDLKVARLLPGEVRPDEEDLALLEARDLLFARLLQYRAYREAAALFGGLLARESRFWSRTAGLEERFVRLLPEVELGVDARRLAEIAARVLAPRPTAEVSVGHVHAPRVSVREQMHVVLERLRDQPTLSFRAVCAGCGSLAEVVGRFLALLELYREDRVTFAQAAALGDLQVHLVHAAADRDATASASGDPADPGESGDPADPGAASDGAGS
jgi:segregation and condensation protein A